jgi:uncharacterized OB-fold protein
MEKCTKCGEGFVPGSIYQTKCKECLFTENEDKINELHEVNRRIV